MSNQAKKWEVLDDSLVVDQKSLVSILLKNRGIKGKREKEEFINPPDPSNISLIDLGIKKEAIKNTIDRIKKAKREKEFVIIYGDYDADGITASAILWETLHEIGLEVLPFIPDRFEDGYGIKPEAVEKLKSKFPKLSLIITVDNGIVAYEGIKKAKELGIDTIVLDHHQKGSKKVTASCLLHTTSVCGSALTWFFSKELVDKLKIGNLKATHERLSLAAIGTIADQMTLTGINRSIVKFGLMELTNTKRPGLLALFKEARIESVGVYEIGFVIAPRINAMGRIKHGLESLRLICTKNKEKALLIAESLGKTNRERQRIVEEVLLVAKRSVTNRKIIVVAGENYHEGVIGLAAGRLVEEFYRPSIVFSVKGDTAKASARSISGFDIIEAIRIINLHIEGGGHPMAAGFSIETKKIKKFEREINKYANEILTSELLQKRIKIDCKIDFDLIDRALVDEIKSFDPVGLGNPQPIFETKGVTVIDAKPVGREAKHIKLKLRQNEHIFDSIYFGGGEIYSKLSPETKIDIVYSVEENVWNGYTNIQLKIRDLKIA